MEENYKENYDDDDSSDVIMTIMTIVLLVVADLLIAIFAFHKVNALLKLILIITFNILSFVGLFFQPMGIISSGLFIATVGVLAIYSRGRVKWQGIKSYKSFHG